MPCVAPWVSAPSAVTPDCAIVVFVRTEILLKIHIGSTPARTAAGTISGNEFPCIQLPRPPMVITVCLPIDRNALRECAPTVSPGHRAYLNRPDQQRDDNDYCASGTHYLYAACINWFSRAAKDRAAYKSSGLVEPGKYCGFSCATNTLIVAFVLD